MRNAIPFDPDKPGIKGSHERGHDIGGQAFRHGGKQDSAVGFGEQARGCGHPPGRERPLKIKPAEQATGIDAGRNFPERNARGKRRAQEGLEAVADRPCPGPHDHDAQPCRIPCEQSCCKRRVSPTRPPVAHAARISVSARSIRTEEPVSSSGLRRSRCLSAMVATVFS